VDFGLPSADGEPPPELIVNVGGLEVRISGRIDRVDQATLPDGSVGFWIIDYKTGRAEHYTGRDLEDFRRLQLTLYALAVQEILLARPLGPTAGAGLLAGVGEGAESGPAGEPRQDALADGNRRLAQGADDAGNMGGPARRGDPRRLLRAGPAQA